MLRAEKTEKDCCKSLRPNGLRQFPQYSTPRERGKLSVPQTGHAMKTQRIRKTNTQHREEKSKRSKLRAEILRRVTVSRNGYVQRYTLRDVREAIRKRAERVREETIRDAQIGIAGRESEFAKANGTAPEIGYTLPALPLRNVNPLFDQGQRTFEKAESKRAERETTYHEIAYAKACAFADAHVRRSRIPCAHLRAELVTEAESAIGEFIAQVMTKYPRFGCDCLAKFACNAWGPILRRRLAAHAHRAMDARLRRLAKTDTVEPAFFLAILGEDGNKHDEGAMENRIRETVATLTAKVIAIGSQSGTKAKAARAHLAFLAHAREYLLASIHGTNTRAFANELVRHRVTVTHKLVTRDEKGRIRGTNTWETEESTRDAYASHRALYNRIRRLETFVGGFGESKGKRPARDARAYSAHGDAASNPAFIA